MVKVLFNDGSGDDVLDASTGTITGFTPPDVTGLQDTEGDEINCFGGGNDIVVGGSGNDIIRDLAGTVVNLNGGGGNDTIEISFTFTSGTINGGNGTDILQCNHTNLSLLTITNVETLGADGVSGRASDFTLYTTIIYDSAHLGFDADIDLIAIGAPTFLDLRSKLVGRGLHIDGSSDSETIIGALDGVNSMRGGGGNDQLVGGNNSDILNGDDGNDGLIGLLNGDTLNGGSGNDTLDGGAGDDRLDGGLGNDTFLVDSEGDQVIEGISGGTDVIVTSLGSYSIAALANIENLTGDAAVNTLTGNTGKNVLSGLAGNDRLIGGDGNDTLDGGVGADRLEGGKGNDTYIVDNKGDAFLDTAGTDTMRASITKTLTNSIENLVLIGTAAINGTGNFQPNKMTGNSAKNTLKGSGGNDTINGLGGNDTLDGGTGVDRLDGGAGNDKVLGGSAQDKLFGGFGKDTLNGGAGADVLTGGHDRDVLTGGADKDIFDFNAREDSGFTASTRDRITDFKPGTDRIDLKTIDANGTSSGNGKFVFLDDEGAKFHGVRGELRYFHSGANTVVEADFNGDKHGDFQIEVAGHKTLTAGDFVL